VATDEVDGELAVTVATTGQGAWCGSCEARAHPQGGPVTLVRNVDAFDLDRPRAPGQCGYAAQEPARFA
jgi:hypothetical protein